MAFEKWKTANGEWNITIVASVAICGLLLYVGLYYFLVDDRTATAKQIEPGNVPAFEDWGILPSEWPNEDWSDVAPTDAEWDVWKREAEEQRALRRRRF